MWVPSNAVEYTAQPVLRHPPNSKETRFIHDAMDFGMKLPTAESGSPRGEAPVLIDNTALNYIEIRLPCGVRVMCAPGILRSSPMVLRSLQSDTNALLKLLPKSVHALIRRSRIWVNETYAYGSRDDPQVLRHSTAHHSETWLIHCARDIPEKARGVEIYNCRDYERMRLHWNGCGLLLHEFCHLIHQFCLDLENDQVKQLFETARYSGRYDRTLRRDWAGLEEDYDLAYAMVDQKEFFAEMSVTFLSNGYRKLDKADKHQMEACSPPLLQPSVSDRVLKRHNILDQPLDPTETATMECSFLTFPSLISATRKRQKPKLRIVDPEFQATAIRRSCLDVVHCNKFYPFTRGQLRHHDPDLFKAMQELWRKIATWDDPEDDSKALCTRKSLLWLPPLFC